MSVNTLPSLQSSCIDTVKPYFPKDDGKNPFNLMPMRTDLQLIHNILNFNVGLGFFPPAINYCPTSTNSCPQLIDVVENEKHNLSAANGYAGSNQQQLIEVTTKHDQRGRHELDGWKEIHSRYPDYAPIFLLCDHCRKKPHCHCGKENCCAKKCPNKDEITKNTSGKGPQRSHCPTCLRIGNNKHAGISYHNFSDLIEVYCCASCEDFYRRHSLEDELVVKMKCDSKSDQKGQCLNGWSRKLNFNLN